MNKLEILFQKKPKSLVELPLKKNQQFTKILYLVKEVVDVHRVVIKNIVFVPKIMPSVLQYVNVLVARMTKYIQTNLRLKIYMNIYQERNIKFQSILMHKIKMMINKRHVVQNSKTIQIKTNPYMQKQTDYIN